MIYYIEGSDKHLLKQLEGIIVQENNLSTVKHFHAFDTLKDAVKSQKPHAVFVYLQNEYDAMLSERFHTEEPHTNLIFIADDDSYAEVALRTFASGYLVTPVSQKDISCALSNLRYH